MMARAHLSFRVAHRLRLNSDGAGLHGPGAIRGDCRRMAIESQSSVQDVDIKRRQQRLLSYGQLLKWK